LACRSLTGASARISLTSRRLVDYSPSPLPCEAVAELTELPVRRRQNDRRCRCCRATAGAARPAEPAGSEGCLSVRGESGSPQGQNWFCGLKGKLFMSRVFLHPCSGPPRLGRDARPSDAPAEGDRLGQIGEQHQRPAAPLRQSLADRPVDRRGGHPNDAHISPSGARDHIAVGEPRRPVLAQQFRWVEGHAVVTNQSGSPMRVKAAQ
jgi:hypothetical protein